VFKSAPTHPSSADPQKEPISAETTDASGMAEDENPPTLLPNVAKVSPQNSWFFIQFSPFSDHLPCQALPEEIFTQEQKSDSLPIESDSADVNTQTVEPPI